MRVLFLFLIVFLNGCNPERVEKVGQSLETTANILNVLAPLDRYVHQKVYDYEYKGEYKDNKRHGYGTYIWKDKKSKGQKYVGYWKNNRMHGKGKMTFSNGDRYVGEFKNDKYDGEGTYIYNNGNQQEGIWKDGFFQYAKKLNTNSSTQKVKTKTYDMGHGQKLTVDVSNNTHTHSSNVVKISEKKEEELGFWGKTDKFLGQIADGISKEDTITGLRTLDKPFHNEEDYRKQGEKTFNFILNKAKKQNVRILLETDPQFIRVKNIVDRLVDASHYRKHKDKVKYAVIDVNEFQALAFGGGYFVVFTGLMNQTNDDELAFVIAHELAHNTAGHIEESYFLKLKDVFGDKPSTGYSKSFTNVMEQEADRIAIIYTALAGYDPRGGATIWEKRPSSIQDYAFYRTHPPNDQRAKAVRYASSKIMKYYKQGIVNPSVEKILQCNELFCKKGGTKLADGKGGGFIKSLEVIADAVVKNEAIKKEKKLQEKEISQSRNMIAKNRLITPPKIRWDNTVAFRYEGKVNRHNQVSGNTFGFSRDLSRGKFYYNFNNQLVEANMYFHSKNQNGYWFRWNDNWGQGFVNLKEYTDGSMRGNIYIDDGTNPGKLMGEFNGFRK